MYLGSPLLQPKEESTVDDETSTGDASFEKSETVTFQQVETANKRQKQKLISSDGFEFIVKHQRGEATYWQCAQRSEVTECKAAVVETAGVYERGDDEHTHPPCPSLPRAPQVTMVTPGASKKAPDTGKKQCPYCPKSYSKNSVLIIHMRTHTGEKPYKCDYCPKRFIRNSDKQVHERSHTGEKPFCCDLCGQAVITRSKLLLHKKRHHPGQQEPLLKCPHCTATFVFRNKLICHLKNLHENDDASSCELCDASSTGKCEFHALAATWQYTCGICDRSFANNRSLIEHCRTHTGERPYQCDLCEKSFKHKHSLKAHQKTHGNSPTAHTSTADQTVCPISDDSRCNMNMMNAQHHSNISGNTEVQLKIKTEAVYNCELCGMHFDTNEKYEHHKSSQHTHKSFPCPVCLKVFHKSSGLNRHMKYHREDKPHMCEHCGKGFLGSCEFKEHLASHTGEKTHKCETCGKMFASGRRLNMHKKTHSSDRGCHTCKLCFQRFTKRDSLNCHLRMHTGELLVCPYCPKSYVRNSSLNIHIRKHTGENPHKCNYCSKTFIRSSDRKVHERSHTGEKPYHCEECGMWFTTSSRLGKHKKIRHSRGHAHRCPQCDKTFTFRNRLLRHMKNHHGNDDTSRCELCEASFTGKCELHVQVATWLHTCSICDRSFADSGSLLQHCRVHTGERPYKCHECHKSFRFTSSLSRHRRMHSETASTVTNPDTPRLNVDTDEKSGHKILVKQKPSQRLSEIPYVATEESQEKDTSRQTLDIGKAEKDIYIKQEPV